MNHPVVEEKIVAKLMAVLTSTCGSDRRRWMEEVVDFKKAKILVYLKVALAEILRDNKFYVK